MPAAAPQQPPLPLRRPPAPVGILGGMGPAAGADFARRFVQACTGLLQAHGAPVTDQAYPPHWLAQLPVPDRSAALAGAGEAPLDALVAAGRQLAGLGARTLALACNTAHAWHAPLQARLPGVAVLHGVREAALQLRAGRHGAACVLATEGTYASGLYQAALADAGLACHLPSAVERGLLMEGIYAGVKAGDLGLARARFGTVARAVAQRHGCRTVLMACTEIPLALDGTGLPGLDAVDATALMARALALHAYGLHEGPPRDGGASSDAAVAEGFPAGPRAGRAT